MLCGRMQPQSCKQYLLIFGISEVPLMAQKMNFCNKEVGLTVKVCGTV